MAEVTIRLLVDRATGRKDVVISYTSDADALPAEHEEEHKRIVEKLIEGGVIRAGELGKVVVERVSPSEVASPLGENETAREGNKATNRA
ncbi:MAG: hypothetical protein HOV80_17875 [Polyangiaceae bacterium]|nr:hypothetical protein [Polyangiaceae bacterium]